MSPRVVLKLLLLLIVVLVVAIVMLLPGGKPPTPVTRSPYVPEHAVLLDMATLRENAVRAQLKLGMSGTVTSDEIAIMTAGQWLTLIEGDTMFPYEMIPRSSPLYILKTTGSYTWQSGDGRPAEQIAELITVLHAETGVAMEVKTFPAETPKLVIDAAILDDGVTLHSPVTPTPVPQAKRHDQQVIRFTASLHQTGDSDTMRLAFG